jgi:hypothetical protein
VWDENAGKELPFPASVSMPLKGPKYRPRFSLAAAKRFSLDSHSQYWIK